MPSPLRNVAYIHSELLVKAADALPSNLGRAGLVHALTDALELLDSGDESSSAMTEPRARVIQSKPATRAELERFHDARYLDALLGVEQEPTSSDEDGSDASSPLPVSGFRLRTTEGPSPSKKRKVAAFGLEDDCPMFDLLPDYVLEVGGASIQAARELRDGRADVAIAWTGGRHHGKRGEAAGFCYVQDIVVAILELRQPPARPSPPASPPSDDPEPTPPPPRSQRVPQKIGRVLYIDLDVHHGDGVEAAFASTPHVLTLSAHLHGPGFYPSTGSLSSTGPNSSPASYHALNLALEPGLCSATFLRLFDSCIEPTMSAFKPDAIVVQCGCDGLAGDPCKEWNLDLAGMGEVVSRILGWGKKTLLLGGGGYDNANVARCWSYLTSVALGRPLDLNMPIPSSIDDFAVFGPSFSLDVSASGMRDRNTEESVATVEKAFRDYVTKLDARYHDK